MTIKEQLDREIKVVSEFHESKREESELQIIQLEINEKIMSPKGMKFYPVKYNMINYSRKNKNFNENNNNQFI